MGLYVDIEKTVGNFSLRAQFEIADDTLGVLGASGCGKSMTLKCIAGIETPDAGCIVLNGKTLYDGKKQINIVPQKRGIGYLFQNYALFPNMTVTQNIGISVKKKDRMAIVDKLVKAFYLEEVKTQYPSQLSGGQQQRVAIARIMASSPEVLLLDEPFSALDSSLKWQLEQELLGTLDGFKKPVLFVSHDKEEVYHFCKKIVVLENGKMEAVRLKECLFQKPQTIAEAKLLGYKNIVALNRLTGDYATIPGLGGLGCSTVGISDVVNWVAIKEEDLMVVEESKGDSILTCRVLHCVENIDSVLFVLQLEEGKVGRQNPLYLQLAKQQASTYNKGDVLKIKVQPEKLIFLNG